MANQKHYILIRVLLKTIIVLLVNTPINMYSTFEYTEYPVDTNNIKPKTIPRLTIDFCAHIDKNEGQDNKKEDQNTSDIQKNYINNTEGELFFNVPSIGLDEVGPGNKLSYEGRKQINIAHKLWETQSNEIFCKNQSKQLSRNIGEVYSVYYREGVDEVAMNKGKKEFDTVGSEERVYKVDMNDDREEDDVAGDIEGVDEVDNPSKPYGDRNLSEVR